MRGLESCAALVAATFLAYPLSAATRTVAPGIEIILGTFPEGQQPDGNTVIFSAPEGLIVMDTGRHVEHTRQILDFAQRAQQPVRAIINSHWHLDHIGGNSLIRESYPDVRIHASGALEGALHGFLASYRKDLEGALRKMPESPQAAGWRHELMIIAAAPQSVPDERVERSGTKVIAGRTLVVHLEGPAATAGDVWVFDSASQVVAAGDLVTLPVPFLDTACPEGWKSALANLAQTRFMTLIPGHGEPMNRAGFDTYRRAFGRLLACADAREHASGECVDGWIRDAGPLLTDADPQRTRKMMDYYVTNALRGKSTISELCKRDPPREPGRLPS